MGIYNGFSMLIASLTHFVVHIAVTVPFVISFPVNCSYPSYDLSPFVPPSS